MTGSELIAAERQRQIGEEGWTPEHDATHTHGEMADAAVCYALRPEVRTYTDRGDPHGWPWDVSWWKPSTSEDGSIAGRVRELVKAAALIAAEIDRLQAEAALTTTPE